MLNVYAGAAQRIETVKTFSMTSGKYYTATFQLDVGSCITSLSNYILVRIKNPSGTVIDSRTYSSSGAYSFGVVASGTGTGSIEVLYGSPNKACSFNLYDMLVYTTEDIVSTVCEGDTSGYVFGFNGEEKLNEQYGEGNAYDFGARIYDPRIAKFISVDPDAKKYPFMSPYCFAGNNPIMFIDEQGRGPIVPKSWWYGKSYAHGFAAGVVDNLFVAGSTTVVTVLKNGTYVQHGMLGFSVGGPIGLAASIYGTSKIWGDDKAAIETYQAVIPLMNSQEARDNLVKAVSEALGDYYVSLAGGEPTNSEQGYFDGKLAVNFIGLFVGVTEIQAAMKTGSFGKNVLQEIKEGIVYLRKDATGLLKDYVGQAKNRTRFLKRQQEHARKNPDSDFEFEILDEGAPGKDLDMKEQFHIDQRGGPTNKSNPNGGLSNKKNVIRK